MIEGGTGELKEVVFKVFQILNKYTFFLVEKVKEAYKRRYLLILEKARRDSYKNNFRISLEYNFLQSSRLYSKSRRKRYKYDVLLALLKRFERIYKCQEERDQGVIDYGTTWNI